MQLPHKTLQFFEMAFFFLFGDKSEFRAENLENVHCLVFHASLATSLHCLLKLIQKDRGNVSILIDFFFLLHSVVYQTNSHNRCVVKSLPVAITVKTISAKRCIFSQSMRKRKKRL